MITSKVLKEVLEDLDLETLINELDKPHDYMLLEVHIFNVGSYATVECVDYDEDVEKEAIDNGMVFCAKEDFLRLWKESEAKVHESLEPYL